MAQTIVVKYESGVSDDCSHCPPVEASKKVIKRVHLPQSTTDNSESCGTQCVWLKHSR